MVDEKKLNRFMLTLHIIWFAQLLSLLVYLIVALYVVKAGQSSVTPATFTTFRTVLYILSLIILFITNPVRKSVLNKKIPSVSPDNWQKTVFPRYLRAMIIACVLSESIGIYGLVLYLLGHNVFDLYVLIAVSAAAMLRYRPKKEEVVSLGEAGQSI